MATLAAVYSSELAGHAAKFALQNWAWILIIATITLGIIALVGLTSSNAITEGGEPIALYDGMILGVIGAICSAIVIGAAIADKLSGKKSRGVDTALSLAAVFGAISSATAIAFGSTLFGVNWSS